MKMCGAAQSPSTEAKGIAIYCASVLVFVVGTVFPVFAQNEE